MSDLTDRMRTCAARILSDHAHVRDDEDVLVYRDAADLLIEAANTLDGLVVPLPLGEPMAIIPPQPETLKQQIDQIVTETEASMIGDPWIAPGGALPGLKTSGTISRRHCPNCDSRTYKTVRRVSCAMMITCQVCGHEWQIS